MFVHMSETKKNMNFNCSSIQLKKSHTELYSLEHDGINTYF